MRLLSELHQYRRIDLELCHAGAAGDYYCGIFVVPSPVNRKPLRCIVSTLESWDHVSVSHPKRIPNWIEMDYLKRLFFREEECAMQLHVPATDHVNNHPHCLHLWRPHEAEIPRPPGHFVGVRSMSSGEVKAAIKESEAKGEPRWMLQARLAKLAVGEKSA